MSCPICAAPTTGKKILCTRCSALIEYAPEAPRETFSFRGSRRSQVRDRQWLFKHAKEVIEGNCASIPDLVSLRDRMPTSQRGMILRRSLERMIQAG